MIEALRGRIQTVTGPIEPDDLGVTLIHEHLYFDLTCYYQPPQDEKGKRLTDRGLSLSTLGWVRNNTMTSLPNLRSYDDDVIASEVRALQGPGRTRHGGLHHQRHRAQSGRSQEDLRANWICT